jgi:hypothetical protein
MRSAYPLAILWLLLTAAAPLAQENDSGTAPQGDRSGPVVQGRHRQPTPGEIQARERAQGESEKAIQEQRRKEDQTIDELYKELMKPVPKNEMSGQSGQPSR